MNAGMDGEHSAASANLGGDTFVGATIQEMGGGATAEASVVAPMLGVLGDDSSSSNGEDDDGTDASPSRDTEVGSVDHAL